MWNQKHQRKFKKWNEGGEFEWNRRRDGGAWHLTNAPEEGDRVYDDNDDDDADYVENDNNMVDETNDSNQQTNSDNDDEDVLDWLVHFD